MPNMKKYNYKEEVKKELLSFLEYSFENNTSFTEIFYDFTYGITTEDELYDDIIDISSSFITGINSGMYMQLDCKSKTKAVFDNIDVLKTIFPNINFDRSSYTMINFYDMVLRLHFLQVVAREYTSEIGEIRAKKQGKNKTL